MVHFLLTVRSFLDQNLNLTTTCCVGATIGTQERSGKYLLYDLRTDPLLSTNIAAQNANICERLKSLAIADAGGKIPEFLRQMSGQPGCTPLVAREW